MEVEIHEHGIAVFKNAMSDDLCDAFVNQFKSTDAGLYLHDHHNLDYVKGTRYQSKTVQLTGNRAAEAQLSAMVGELMDAYFHIFNTPKDTRINQFSVPTIKRYAASTNDQFLTHYDALGDTVSRSLAMIWYLNTVDEGGETRFPFLDIAIKPERGACLVFPPFWNYIHKANRPLSGDKYTFNLFGNIRP